jgi:hypothetical protein
MIYNEDSALSRCLGGLPRLFGVSAGLGLFFVPFGRPRLLDISGFAVRKGHRHHARHPPVQ